MKTIHHLISFPITNSSQSKPIDTIRVCTNRTCRRQGSLQTLQTLTALAPTHVTVTSSGCLGRCGSGPNLVALPGPTFLSHCGTPARAARALLDLCGFGSDDHVVRNCLDALALLNSAQTELNMRNFSLAQDFFTRVIEAEPIGGLHVAYMGRSSARLASGNSSGALEDAKKSLQLYPQYDQAYICQGDALLAMDQLEAAEESYVMALDVNPSLRRSKSFKARVEKLNEKLTSTATS